MKNLSRREFLRRCMYSLGSIYAAQYLSGCATTCPDNIAAPHRAKRVLADLHIHPLLNDWISRSPIAEGLKDQFPMIDAILYREMNKTSSTWKSSHAAGVDVMCVAHFNPFDEFLTMPTDPNPDAVRQTLRMMDILEADLKKNERYATLARRPDELIRLTSVDKESDWGKFRIAVVHALEGGHALGGDIDSLNGFAKRGVAMVGITHFFTKTIATSANSIPYFPDANARWPYQGLSEFGAAVIRRMEDLGMIVDISHGTAATIEDVLKIAKKPVASSHSASRTLGEHPYSLYDEHVQQITQKGGIVGVILMPYWLSNFSDTVIAEQIGSLDDVVRTIRYLYKICGHRHENIGIGTDFAGYIPALSDMTCHAQIGRLREKLSLEFDGEEGIVEDIMANNVIRFLKNNWTFSDA